VTEDEKIIRSFLEQHPDFIVFGGPLYRVVEGQVVKGLNVIMHAQSS
jgi:hypothetical protein